MSKCWDRHVYSIFDATLVGYWVYENKVLFISSKKEAFGFIVESAELADMLRKQFEIFWKMSKDVKK